jgi:hypothetical protein
MCIHKCLCPKPDAKEMALDRGEDRLTKDLDVGNIIKDLRQMKVMMKVFLNKNQRVLLKFDRSQLLDKDEIDSEDEKKQSKKAASEVKLNPGNILK